MSSTQSDTYLLGRGDQASARLSFQHYALKSRQGWLFHSSVQAHLSSIPNPRIVDLATGNAIWAYEVARELPHAEVVGLDISPAQYPRPNTRPRNVELGVLGFMDPVPTHYQGYFDVVHVRLVCAAVYSLDKERLMSNILSMVKPGGFIQWDELTWPTWWTVDADLKVGTHMHSAIERMFKLSPFNEGTQWAEGLPRLIEQLGFVDVVGFKPPMMPDNLPLESQSMAWSIRELLEFAVTRGIEDAEMQLDLATREIQEGSMRGESWFYSLLVTVGRKPG